MPVRDTVLHWLQPRLQGGPLVQPNNKRINTGRARVRPPEFYIVPRLVPVLSDIKAPAFPQCIDQPIHLHIYCADRFVISYTLGHANKFQNPRKLDE